MSTEEQIKVIAHSCYMRMTNDSMQLRGDPTYCITEAIKEGIKPVADDRDKLYRALDKAIGYIEHRPSCAYHNTEFCDCGMREVMIQTKEALGWT